MLADIAQYTNHSAQTATPGRLVVMLYDGFLRFAAQARAAYQSGDVGEGGLRLTRAQDIVTELRVSLDMTQGEISENLAAIYEYIGERLTAVRAGGDIAAIDEAVRHMKELREAWAAIAATPKPFTGGRPVVGVNLAG
ncbi:MAG TPA: flagellar export chaperone FliS [Miltoncostaeaceae bacterium]|nr:flagellar export chaperone FliS [Miltoncostaeaceae bacterium]